VRPSLSLSAPHPSRTAALPPSSSSTSSHSGGVHLHCPSCQSAYDAVISYHNSLTSVWMHGCYAWVHGCIDGRI
jgi:hypothetical protein